MSIGTIDSPSDRAHDNTITVQNNANGKNFEILLLSAVISLDFPSPLC